MVTPARHAQGSSRVALKFFVLVLGTLAVAAIVAFGLLRILGRPHAGRHLVFPPVFAFSTGLLLAGSLTLHRAVGAVRLERQRAFRGWLLLSLLSASLFMGLQVYGLWSLLPADREPSEASLGVTGFVLALATLHALHFLVTVMFVCFVTARAIFDRYDHEYYWGVTVCAWFWHALTIVWGGILCIFAVAL